MSERCPITTMPSDRARRRGYDKGWFAARSVGKKEKKRTLDYHNSLGFLMERHTHREIFGLVRLRPEEGVRGGYVGCGIIFHQTSVLLSRIWTFLFAMDLNRCTRAVSTPAWLAQTSHVPSNRRRNGHFQTSFFNPATFVALFSPIGLLRAPSHIDE